MPSGIGVFAPRMATAIAAQCRSQPQARPAPHKIYLLSIVQTFQGTSLCIFIQTSQETSFSLIYERHCATLAQG